MDIVVRWLWLIDRRLYSRRVLPLSSARIMLSRKSGLDGGLDELGKPELVAADGFAAVSGKEGS
jgi:hypothetical protein